MKTTIRVTLPSPTPPRKPKNVYAGEKEARQLLHKCFVIDNEIGEVNEITKDSKRKCWCVLFQHINSYSTYRDEYTGLFDGFTAGSRTYYPALQFIDEAKEADRTLLDKAKEISKQAADEINKLIYSTYGK